MTEFNDEILFPVNYSARKIRCIVEEINPNIQVKEIEIYKTDDRIYIYLTIDYETFSLNELFINENLDYTIEQMLVDYFKNLY
jgi:hypothetical protein